MTDTNKSHKVYIVVQDWEFGDARERIAAGTDIIYMSANKDAANAFVRTLDSSIDPVDVRVIGLYLDKDYRDKVGDGSYNEVTHGDL